MESPCVGLAERKEGEERGKQRKGKGERKGGEGKGVDEEGRHGRWERKVSGSWFWFFNTQYLLPYSGKPLRENANCTVL